MIGITLLIIIATIVVIILIIKFSSAVASRCPRCSKKSALVEINRTLLKKDKVSKIERHYSYNKKGERIGGRDVRVYGTRYVYEVKYACRHCGYSTKKSIYVDRY